MEFAKSQVKQNTGWTDEYVSAVFAEFERFMVLKAADDDISPCDDVDILWHQIILDTHLYYDYCHSHFGKLIHHYPQGAVDQVQRKARLDRTAALYKQLFNGEEPPNNIWRLLECSICFKELGGHNAADTTRCCNNKTACRTCLSAIDMCPFCRSDEFWSEFTIKIKSIAGPILIIQTTPKETILDLKEKICNKSGYPSDMQRLIYNGRTPEDNKTISEIGIRRDQTLYVVVTCRGC